LTNNVTNQYLAMTKLTKGQYIEFLKFCKKHGFTKAECTRIALIKFCRFTAPNVKEIFIKTIDEELEALTK